MTTAEVVHVYFSLRRMGIRPAGAWRFAMNRQHTNR